MSKIAVIGATGYAGGNIVNEALSRGHSVIAVSRHAPATPAAGVEVRTGSIDDDAFIDALFADADVAVVAVHGAVDDQPYLVKLVPALLAAAVKHGTRVGVVGGAGSLQVGPGGPRVVDLPEFPEQFKAEALSHADVLEALSSSGTTADWFYVSPAGGFGSFAPGVRTGSYRTGDDVLLVDAEGKSEISGEDFAIAFVDEIESHAHPRARITVAY